MRRSYRPAAAAWKQHSPLGRAHAFTLTHTHTPPPPPPAGRAKGTASDGGLDSFATTVRCLLTLSPPLSARPKRPATKGCRRSSTPPPSRLFARSLVCARTATSFRPLEKVLLHRPSRQTRSTSLASPKITHRAHARRLAQSLCLAFKGRKLASNKFSAPPLRATSFAGRPYRHLGHQMWEAPSMVFCITRLTSNVGNPWSQHSGRPSAWCAHCRRVSRVLSSCRCSRCFIISSLCHPFACSPIQLVLEHGEAGYAHFSSPIVRSRGCR